MWKLKKLQNKLQAFQGHSVQHFCKKIKHNIFKKWSEVKYLRRTVNSQGRSQWQSG
jgi:hypothetical protein